MRQFGQAQSDQMRLRSVIEGAVSSVIGSINALDASLSPVAKSGDYADLENTPTLSAVATSGAYSDLTGKPTLGALASQDTVTHSQVSDWSTATSSFLTEHQDISGLLAKAGGTMTGGIIFGGGASAGYVRRATTDAYTAIEGGSSTNNGAVLILSGGTRSGYEGLFRLSARTDSSHIKNLDGRADGTLTWDGSPIVTMASLAPVEIPLTDAEVFSFTTLKAWRTGNVVNVYLYFKNAATAPTAWTVIATGLPAPMMQLKTVASTWGSSYARPVALSVETDGSIKAIYGKASTTYGITFSYVTSESA